MLTFRTVRCVCRPNCGKKLQNRPNTRFLLPARCVCGFSASVWTANDHSTFSSFSWHLKVRIPKTLILVKVLPPHAHFHSWPTRRGSASVFSFNNRNTKRTPWHEHRTGLTLIDLMMSIWTIHTPSTQEVSAIGGRPTCRWDDFLSLQSGLAISDDETAVVRDE